MDDALPAGFDGWTEELKKAWITAQVAKIQAQAQVQVAQIQAQAQDNSDRSAERVAQIQDRTAQIQREITSLRNHRSLASTSSGPSATSPWIGDSTSFSQPSTPNTSNSRSKKD